MTEGLLSEREKRRYSRQIMLSDIGLAGQEKLKKSSILVVGAGGLGCPLLQYLVAAGIGRTAITEFDIVNEANLQRQVLYGSQDVGKLKAIIARDRLHHLNSLVDLEIINLKIDEGNALNVIRGFDLVVDATDNYETRYIVNDACVILNRPLVHGAIYKYEGQVSVFNYKGGPTYRCFNPGTEGKTVKNPRPADTGILGVLPGITGLFMANEVIKVMTGYGEVLSGKMLVFNIAWNRFRLLTINNIPENHRIQKISGTGSYK